MFIAQCATLKQSKTLVIANSATQASIIKQELGLFAPSLTVDILSDYEVLPYERMSPTSKVVANRLKTLWSISSGKLDVLIINVNALQTLLPPKSYIMGRVFDLHLHDQISLTQLRTELVNSDYSLVDKVYEPGEFSIRGNIIDIMPMGSEQLVRTELFDDIIEQITIVEPLTNKTITKIDSFQLIPTHEFPTNLKTLSLFGQQFKQNFPKEKLIDSNLKVMLNFAGREAYLPFFFDQPLDTIFDYLDKASWQVIYYESMLDSLNNNWAEINRRYNLFSYQYPCLKPSQLFITSDNVLAKCNQYPSIIIAQTGEINDNLKALPLIAIENKNITNLAKFRINFSGYMIIAIDNMGALEVIRQTLEQNQLRTYVIDNLREATDVKAIYLITHNLYKGFISCNYAFISQAELYISKPHYLRYKQNKKQLQYNNDSLFDLSQLNINDYVVHVQHGIGKYLGLKTQVIADIAYEMLEIEYAQESKLFIPIEQLDMLSKYSKISDTETVLSKLGSKNWSKLKLKAQKNIDDLASHLLELYARRSAQQGYKFALPANYNDFVVRFGYEPTPDQELAFQGVIQDMTGIKPMDRLICGDVGFGKTEVALRAAFIAVANKKQVALLVPTTLLAEQLYQKFCNRFAGFDINIAEISRFRTAKEITQTLEQAKLGEVDIIIGTHRLIQKDIKFLNLGLVIIDEEHRFGVKQKEKLKNLCINIDFLAMTATPIPRTLSMALEGLREFSIIATPPKDRLAVNTIISKDDNDLIREAILRELRRGGQVYFLYNDVASIDKMHQRLTKLMPEASIAIAHGQMNETALEITIREFIGQKHQILLCSTIIETGIDIANVNTIIIYRADKLGLAGLHQLRGRVGRSHHQAYCYLITPDNISSNANKRLEAIQLTNELGAGFNLAIHDLEIRGAGEILGDSQSGNIKDVGLALYTKMLKNTVTQLNKNKLLNHPQPINSCEVNLNASCIIPSNYCFDTTNRLIYYKRLSSCLTLEEVNHVYTDIINEHGLPPIEVTNLILQHELRIKAQSIGIKKVKTSDTNIHLEFVTKPNIEPTKLVDLLQTEPNCKYDYANNKLSWNINNPNIEAKIKNITGLFTRLQS